MDSYMRCHACAMSGKSEGAVGVCALCGRAACLEHSEVQHLPRYRVSSGGCGGPLVRLPRDRQRFVCSECAAEGLTGTSEVSES